MRGRTNVGGGGVGIYADTENFTVAEGSNVTAGNFVQYKLASDDRKYDTGYGAGSNINDSNNQYPKVFPLGNNRYIRRYKNNGETGLYWFNLVDVSDGFNILSSFTMQNDFVPAFYVLNDGNMALCYMKKDNTFTLEIYDISERFLLLGSYEFTNESVGEKGWVHITQLSDSRIIMNNGNSYFVCNYVSGVPTEDFYGNFGLSGESMQYKVTRKRDCDWNLFTVKEDCFFLFSFFFIEENVSADCKLHLYEAKEEILEEIENVSIVSREEYSPNGAAWGNAFGISGKILYTFGINNIGATFTNTWIYYVSGNHIMQSNTTNLADYMQNAFKTIFGIGAFGYYTSMTVQYTKENIIYVAIEPDASSSNDKNLHDETAIMRMEYNPNSGVFSMSNIVTFEDYFEGKNTSYYKFGYGQFFENDDGEIYYLYETGERGNNGKSGRWLMKLRYKDGVLSIGDSTGLVENYNASGAAIGVAKQSGSSGQVVEVYVPKV